jgi:hypothetical protein
MKLSAQILLFLCLFFTNCSKAFANTEMTYSTNCPTVFEQLCELNKYWKDFNISDPILNKKICFDQHTDLIQLHLRLVEQYLREYPMTELSPLQKTKRSEGLNILQQYWMNKQFPINNHHRGQVVPYFIDDFGTACAVGEMVRKTGFETFAKKVQAESNYAFIEDMEYPELNSWAKEFGFEEMELRWVQPGYSCWFDRTDIYVTNTNNSGVGSINWAVQEAQTDVSPNTIKFDLPIGSIIYPTEQIWLQGECDAIDGALINGTGNIIIDGVNFNGTSWGIVINCDDCEVSNMKIRGYPYTAIGAWQRDFIFFHDNILYGNQTGIRIADGANNTFVSSNIIGVDENMSNNQTIGSEEYGIWIDDANFINISNNTISGVGGTGHYGIVLDSDDIGSDITITGNKIGVDETGTFAIPNHHGISVGMNKFNVQIFNNVISGNEDSGILVHGGNNIEIYDNLIGWDISNQNLMPNDSSGILIGQGGDNIQINNNQIAGKNNTTWGIYCTNASNIYIGTDLEANNNTISNCNVGIGFSNPNNYEININSLSCNNFPILFVDQNFITAPPTITSATTSEIQGTASANASIDLYLHGDTQCAAAPCQGKSYVGTTQANASGNWTYTGNIPSNAEITALATKNEDTSEYADCIWIQNGNSSSICHEIVESSSSIIGAVNEGDVITFDAIVEIFDGTTPEIEWYYSTSPSFNPYNNEGTLFGSGTTAQYFGSPTIEGILINACGGSNQEINNELIVLSTQSSIPMNTLKIDFDNDNDNGLFNNDINAVGSICNFEPISNSYLSELQNISSCVAGTIGQNDNLPSNSLLIIFTDNNPSELYDFSHICQADKSIYISKNTCNRTIEAFSTPSTSDSLGVESNLASSRYRYTHSTSSDGYFIYNVNDQITLLLDGSTSCNSSADNIFHHNSYDVELIVPNSWCNQTVYVKGIVGGLDNSCTSTFTDTYTFSVDCGGSCNIPSEDLLCESWLRTIIDNWQGDCINSSQYLGVDAYTDANGNEYIGVNESPGLDASSTTYYSCTGIEVGSCDYFMGIPQNCVPANLSDLQYVEHIWSCPEPLPECSENEVNQISDLYCNQFVINLWTNWPNSDFDGEAYLYYNFENEHVIFSYQNILENELRFYDLTGNLIELCYIGGPNTPACSPFYEESYLNSEYVIVWEEGNLPLCEPYNCNDWIHTIWDSYDFHELYYFSNDFVYFVEYIGTGFYLRCYGTSGNLELEDTFFPSDGVFYDFYINRLNDSELLFSTSIPNTSLPNCPPTNCNLSSDEILCEPWLQNLLSFELINNSCGGGTSILVGEYQGQDAIMIVTGCFPQMQITYKIYDCEGQFIESCFDANLSANCLVFGQEIDELIWDTSQPFPNCNPSCPVTPDDILCLDWLTPIMEDLANSQLCGQGCLFGESGIEYLTDENDNNFIGVNNNLDCTGEYERLIYDCEGNLIESCTGNYLIVGNNCNPTGTYSSLGLLWDCSQPLPNCSPIDCPINPEEILCMDWVQQEIQSALPIYGTSMTLSTANWNGQELIIISGMNIDSDEASAFDCQGTLIQECGFGILQVCNPSPPVLDFDNDLSNLVEIWNGTMSVPNCGDTPPWPVTPTSITHTIILQNTLNSDIDGTTLQAGDFIGFFYTHNGQEYCAGYDEWTGNTDLTVTVYGNEANAPDKNGFEEEETFAVKVWQNANQSETEVQATYLPVGSLFGLVDATDQFGEDAFSAIGEINTGSCLNIDLHPGTQLISSYIVPNSMAMTDILAPILDDIIEIKNDQGDAIIPQFNIYGFSDWEVTEGYKIKMLNDANLEICGSPVNPLTTAIPLNTGVQWIAYLRDNPSAPIDQMASANPCVLWMKNDDGEAYLPALNPPGNMIEMVPTEGYKLKATCEGFIEFTQNLVGPSGGYNNYVTINQPVSNRNTPLTHFNKGNNTSKDATLVFPRQAVEYLLNEGDEIGAFNEIGTACGAGKFEGQHFYLTLWGDDPGTPENEGLIENEAFQLKVWNNITNEEYAISVILEDGVPVFTENALQIVEEISLVTSTNNPASNFAWDIFPNPASEAVHFKITGNQDALIQIDILNLNGVTIETIPLENATSKRNLSIIDWTPGVYWCQLQTKERMFTKKLVIVR